MRYLVISDIHANLLAFETVLEDAKGEYDKIWCLGDVVGYGPHPNECVTRLREFDHLCIAGNHDWAVLDKLDIDEFNPNARFAILWTREQLSQENITYLDNLPVTLQEEDVFTLVHGSPRHPIWEYIFLPKVAQLNFGYFKTPYCLVGHTHSPVIFGEADSPFELCSHTVPDEDQFTLHLNAQRLIINPGSVGQPRDGDCRAAYAILDTEAMEFQIRRIEYPVAEVQALMKANDFPARLWQRLAFGF